MIMLMLMAREAMSDVSENPKIWESRSKSDTNSKESAC